MKKIFLLLSLISILSVNAHSQVSSVTITASGLTCSMCSNAINKSLHTLDFIDKVEANLSNYTFEINFKKGKTPDFGRIRQKVEDAGFFVSGFVATVYFNNEVLKENQAVIIPGNSILFIGMQGKKLNGATKITLLDKGFIDLKQLKSKGYSITEASAGIYHAII